MANSKPTASLMENVLTLLCHDDRHGKIIANMVTADLFESEYRLIAEKAISFWRMYQEAPKDHTPDLVADILENNENPGRASLLARVLTYMDDLKSKINTTYVMGQITNFVRVQNFKRAVLQSAEKTNASEDVALRDIERIWSDVLKKTEIGFDAGMRLTEIPRLLARLEQRQNEFVMGIGVYDRMGVVPARGTLGAMLGVAGDGKTWSLVQTGWRNIAREKKVVHYSLEIDAEDIIQRYMQCMFSITTTKVDKLILPDFDIDPDTGRLLGLGSYKVVPEFSFESRTIRDELELRIEALGKMANNLIIKRFPPNRIEMRDIEAHLDMLETTEKYIPDMILFDAPYLCYVDRKDRRGSIGEHVLNLRAICIERDMSGQMVHQISREGAKQETRRMTHIGEDWSIVQTCDRVDTMSKTTKEKEYGLARLFADKARTKRDKFETLITQNYDIGQFCIQSTLMDKDYGKILKGLEEEEDNDDEDEE